MHHATEPRRIAEIRACGRQSLENAAVTQSEKADQKAVIRFLNEALAVEAEHAEDTAGLLKGFGQNS